MALTYRTGSGGKGSALTIDELDNNFRHFTGSHEITGSVIISSSLEDAYALVLTGSMGISGSIIPNGPGTYNLGNVDNYFEELYVGNNSIIFVSKSVAETITSSISLAPDGELIFTGSLTGSFTGSGNITGSFTGSFDGDLSGSFPLIINDEGVQITSSAGCLDFVGNAVTVTYGDPCTTVTIATGSAGGSGSSGSSGTSGTSGSSGTSGTSGSSGTSGTSGSSGTSGTGNVSGSGVIHDAANQLGQTSIQNEVTFWYTASGETGETNLVSGSRAFTVIPSGSIAGAASQGVEVRITGSLRITGSSSTNTSANIFEVKGNRSKFYGRPDNSFNGFDQKVEVSGSLNISGSLAVGGSSRFPSGVSPSIVVFSDLPTSDPTNAGQIWNDGGTLKVSAG